MKNLNKILLGVAVVAVFVGYVIFNKMQSPSTSYVATTDTTANDTSATVPDTSTTAGGTSAGSETTNPGSTTGTGSSGGTGTTGSGSTGTTGSTATSGAYKNGTYTGPVTDAFYGNYQVAAVISGGKLTDVQFLAYPNDRRESVQINSQSMPKLKAEAIASQSANVNIVSGATQSSQAFQQSLAAALALAK